MTIFKRRFQRDEVEEKVGEVFLMSRQRSGVISPLWLGGAFIGVVGLALITQQFLVSVEKNDEQAVPIIGAEAATSSSIDSDADSLLGSVTEVVGRAFGKSPERLAAETPVSVKAASSVSQGSVSAARSVPTTTPVVSKKEENSVPIAVCSVPTTQAANREVIINEIAWMGTPLASGETTASASRKEWIELLNISSRTVSLASWQLREAEEKSNVLFPSVSLKAGEFYLLSRSGTDSISGKKPDMTFSSALTNDGGHLQLVNSKCELVDDVNATAKWPSGNSETKQTMERNADRQGWHTSVSAGGTPKAENSVAATTIVGSAGSGGGGGGSVAATSGSSSNTQTQAQNQIASATTTTNTSTTTTATNTTTTVATSTASTSTAASSTTLRVLISEVQIGSASSTQEEFVELYNPGTSTVDLTDWSMQKKSKTGTSFVTFLPKTVLDGKSIAAQGFFLIAHPSSSFIADVTTDDGIAAHNTVVLKDPSGDIVDKVGWGEANDFEGQAAAADVEPDMSIQRKVSSATFVDTDNNGQDFELKTCPSPKGFSTTCTTPIASTSTTATSTTNTTSTTSTSSTATSSPIIRLVISEIQITGGVGLTDHDFVKIYNPTTSPADLAGWRLKKRTQSGTESSIKVFSSSSTIASGGTFTWANANDGFSETIGAQSSSTQTLAGDSSVALFDSDNNVVDAVAWGSGHVNPFVESSAFPTNPMAQQLLKRKTVNGVTQDTDNNTDDFLIQ